MTDMTVTDTPNPVYPPVQAATVPVSITPAQTRANRVRAVMGGVSRYIVTTTRGEVAISTDNPDDAAKYRARLGGVVIDTEGDRG